MDRGSIESVKRAVGYISNCKNMSREEKISYILSHLGVVIIEDELRCSANMLQEIIIARMTEECPICKGNGFDRDFKIKCAVCGGKGYMLSVVVERILIKKKSDESCSCCKESILDPISNNETKQTGDDAFYKNNAEVLKNSALSLNPSEEDDKKMLGFCVRCDKIRLQNYQWIEEKINPNNRSHYPGIVCPECRKLP